MRKITPTGLVSAIIMCLLLLIAAPTMVAACGDYPVVTAELQEQPALGATIAPAIVGLGGAGGTVHGIQHTALLDGNYSITEAPSATAPGYVSIGDMLGR